ncbi:MAG: hypothetical protein MK168_03710 [Candidatus Thalassarchaeum sp.]|nr:hypothetical protein [Candidatus Thalassarchaeum sp.]
MAGSDVFRRSQTDLKSLGSLESDSSGGSGREFAASRRSESWPDSGEKPNCGEGDVGGGRSSSGSGISNTGGGMTIPGGGGGRAPECSSESSSNGSNGSTTHYFRRSPLFNIL